MPRFKVFVCPTQPSTTCEDIEYFFRDFGNILDIEIKKEFSIVSFEDAESAEKAIREMNGQTLNGQRVTVEYTNVQKIKKCGRVLVEPVSSKADQQDLRAFFKDVGRIVRIHFTSRAAIVTFDEMRDAVRAADTLSHTEFLGKRVTVRVLNNNAESRRPPPRRQRSPIRTNHRVIVQNLTTQIDWKGLKNLMSEAGVVTYANAHNRQRNQGVVEFATERDMWRAIDTLSDTKLNGRRIKIVPFVDILKEQGEHRQGVKRSRSSSRSRMEEEYRLISYKRSRIEY